MVVCEVGVDIEGFVLRLVVCEFGEDHGEEGGGVGGRAGGVLGEYLGIVGNTRTLGC